MSSPLELIKKTMMCIEFKSDDDVIPDNFSISERRLNSLQRKFDKDPSLFENYCSIFEDYKSQGIIEEVGKIMEN